MTDITIPREAAMKRVKAFLRWTRNTESERKWSTAVGYLAGWGVATLMLPIVIGQHRIIANRPIPKPEIWVSFVDQTGHPVGPARPDLTRPEHDMVMRSFITQYVRYRVGYDWDTIRTQARWVEQVTQGKEQARYSEYMRPSNPNGPVAQLGATGKITVTWVGQADPMNTNVYAVPYRVQLIDKGGISHPEEWRTAIVTYSQADDMPPNVAVNNDPLRAVVTGFSINSDQQRQ